MPRQRPPQRSPRHPSSHPRRRPPHGPRRPILGDAAQRERGQVTLQHVIMFPALLLLLSLATQTCLWYLARTTALSAAQEGVRAARADGAPSSAGQQAALEFARRAGSGFLDQPAAQVTGDAASLQVRVTGTVPSFVPGLTLRISQVARGARERFTTPDEP
ncbi:TadE/TadG family type IV pilus assembly protein [Acrocarpospora sp. B8E8]|uniref:TadE/TadG family type IV pilus assembly protein n=1 Tax=Acrocarpospora sp. B8E8 TaxID=3153572 RepID=UPI00325CCBE3